MPCSGQSRRFGHVSSLPNYPAKPIFLATARMSKGAKKPTIADELAAGIMSHFYDLTDLSSRRCWYEKDK